MCECSHVFIVLISVFIDMFCILHCVSVKSASIFVTSFWGLRPHTLGALLLDPGELLSQVPLLSPLVGPCLLALFNCYCCLWYERIIISAMRQKIQSDITIIN